MADEVGRGVLNVEADSVGVSAGLAQAGKAVEDFERKAVKAADSTGASMTKAGTDTDRASSRIEASTKRFIASLERESARVGKTRSEWLEYRAAQLGVSNESRDMIARIRESEKVVLNYGNSAKQTAAAMRLLPAQITDIVTGLISGQPAYLVAIQQGGQLKDSFGGIVPAAKALLSVFSPLKLAVMAGAATFGALIYAQVQGAKEAQNYVRALALTGNAAGTTAGQLDSLARSIAQTTGSQSAAAEALAKLAGTGRVGAENLERFGRVAVEMNRTVGIEVGDTVKAFEELGTKPVEASLRLNERYRYLTAAVYEQVKALEDQGRAVEAAKVAQQAFADAQDQIRIRVERSLGPIEELWRRVKDAISGAKNALLDFGREPSTEQSLAEARRRLEAARARPGTFGQEGELKRAQEAVRFLEARLATEQGLASAEGVYVARQQAALKASIEINRIRDQSLSKQQQENRAIQEYRQHVEALRQGRGRDAISPEQMAKDEAAIRERFKEKEKKYQEDAATRMMQQLKQAEASLRAEIDGEQKLSAIARQRVEFEQLISDLRGKRQLTDDQKSLLAAQATLRARLEAVEAIEREAEITKTIRDAEERNRQREIRDTEYLAQLTEQIAGSRANRLEQYGRQIDAFGLGQNAREEVAAQASIFREFERLQARASRNAVARDGFLGSARYAQEVTQIQQALDQALADHANYYTKLRELQANWEVGASQAFQNYVEDARNVARQTEEVFTNALRGVEDLFVEMATTGKASVKDMIRSITADLLRMQWRRLLGGLADQGIFGSSFLFRPSSAASAPIAASSPSWTAGSVPLLDKGLPFVPYDGYPAILHRGERVLTAEENRNGSGGINMTVAPNITVHGNPSRSQIAQMRAIAETMALATTADARRRGIEV